MIRSGAWGALAGWLVVSFAIAVGEGLYRREVVARHPGGRRGLVLDRFIVSAPGGLLAAGALLAIWATTNGAGPSVIYAVRMAAAAVMILVGFLAAKVGVIAAAHRRLATASGETIFQHAAGARR